MNTRKGKRLTSKLMSMGGGSLPAAIRKTCQKVIIEWGSQVTTSSNRQSGRGKQEAYLKSFGGESSTRITREGGYIIPKRSNN